MTTITLKRQLQEFDNGKILDSDGKESTCYNFYDWFCKDSSLKGKSESLYRKVKKFVNTTGIDTNKYYVFFKNNCPMSGPLYDDFRICEIGTGDVFVNITPKSGHSGLAEMYLKDFGFKEPYVTGKNFNEMMKNLDELIKASQSTSFKS